jgi:hypothetical protein
LSGISVGYLVGVGRRIQGKDLVEGFLIGEKADFNQLLPGASQGVVLHGETLTEGLIGVIAQALGIGHGDQKQVKGRCLVAATVDVAVTDQAMIQPAEVFWDFTQTPGTDQMFFYHKGLLCLES